MAAKISDIPAVERLFNLSAFLLGERSPVPLRIIITMVEGYSPLKDFEANRKMFIRDRKELMELGIDIRMSRITDPLSGDDTDGYIIDEENFYLPKINFTAEEINALNEAVLQFAEDKKTTSTDSGLDWARTKLTGHAEGAHSESRVLVQLSQEKNIPDEDIMDAVKNAVVARKRLTIVYTPVGGTRTERAIDPYGLFLRRGLWYVVAYCHLRQSERMFRLDRVESVADATPEKSPTYDIPADFSLSSYIRNRAPWEFGEGEPAKITIKFDDDVFWHVKNLWGNLSSAKFNDAAGEACFESLNDNALISWALEYGEKAEITAPPEARENTIKILEEILSNGGRNK